MRGIPKNLANGLDVTQIRRSIALIAMATIFFGSCKDVDPPDFSGEFSASDTYYLSDPALDRLKRLAESGDRTAAMRVASYYSIYLQDPNRAVKWEEMANRSE